MTLWTTLGLAPTNDEREIRRAYARRLKEVHPEDDPVGFQALREAYEHASNMARGGWAVQTPRVIVRDKADQDADTDPSFDDDEDDAWGEPPLPDTGWTTRPENRWSDPAPTASDDAGWSDADARLWSRPDALAPDPAAPNDLPADLPDDIRDELERERTRAQEHARLCDALGQILASPTPQGEAALDALIRILRSPAMDSLQVHERTEFWLAQAVSNGGPSADALIEPVIQFFGWDASRVGVDMRHAWPVLSRRDLATALRQLQRGDGPGQQAFRRLKAPPTPFNRIRDRFNLGLEKSVAALLARIDHELPGLEAHLDARTIAGWRRRLSGPHLKPSHLWTLIAAPPLIALLVVAFQTFGAPSALDVVALWVVLFTGLVAGGALYVYGVAWPTQRWRTRAPWERSGWIRLGWAPFSAAVLLVSTLIPAVWPWVALYLALFCLVSGWTRVTTSHLPAAPRENTWFSYLLLNLPLLVWLVAHAHGYAYVGLCWAAGGAVAIARLGMTAMEEAWLGFSPALRQRLGLGLAVTAALTAILIVAAPSWPVRTVAAGLVMVLALAARPIGRTQVEKLRRITHGWSLFGWIVCLIALLALPGRVVAIYTFAAFGVWLVVGPLLTGLFEASPRLEALLSRLQPRRKKGKDKFG